MRLISALSLFIAVIMLASCSKEEEFFETISYSKIEPAAATTTGTFTLTEQLANAARGELVLNNPQPGVTYKVRVRYRISPSTNRDFIDLEFPDINPGGNTSSDIMYEDGAVYEFTRQQTAFRFGFQDFTNAPGWVYVYENTVDDANLAFTILMNER